MAVTFSQASWSFHEPDGAQHGLRQLVRRGVDADIRLQLRILRLVGSRLNSEGAGLWGLWSSVILVVRGAERPSLFPLKACGGESLTVRFQTIREIFLPPQLLHAVMRKLRGTFQHCLCLFVMKSISLNSCDGYGHHSEIEGERYFWAIICVRRQRESERKDQRCCRNRPFHSGFPVSLRGWQGGQAACSREL